MRRTLRASASRLCGRVCAAPVIVGMLLATVFSNSGGIAAAEPGSSDTIGTLVAAVANANQKLQELGAAVQAQQESVNKAIVDVETARDNAAAAQLRGGRQPATPSTTPTPRSRPRSSASTPSRRRRTSTVRRVRI